ncbi:GATA-binding transcription factor [Cavenderia fasciculata]|uniref:GATA-binding transcription factor n=1 Tax=Cavenderia fasciculata TaxID=261658 RepID=F4PVB2_CACFS|nr:GATA-binding transcription factor [Cavenderia fasciculata]EGG19926.1 GATA-binding transcription factor [Cavenderia fasciculata]|eukprot:XP_004366909.1 GATA-binding transcription factor [Cavenderia fasciculata]
MEMKESLSKEGISNSDNRIKNLDPTSLSFSPFSTTSSDLPILPISTLSQTSHHIASSNETGLTLGANVLSCLKKVRRTIPTSFIVGKNEPLPDPTLNQPNIKYNNVQPILIPTSILENKSSNPISPTSSKIQHHQQQDQHQQQDNSPINDDYEDENSDPGGYQQGNSSPTPLISSSSSSFAMTSTTSTSPTSGNLVQQPNDGNVKKKRRPRAPAPVLDILMCRACGETRTSQWRRGPDGCKSLCNACGIRYANIVNKEKIMVTEPKDNSINCILNDSKPFNNDNMDEDMFFSIAPTTILNSPPDPTTTTKQTMDPTTTTSIKFSGSRPPSPTSMANFKSTRIQNNNNFKPQQPTNIQNPLPPFINNNNNNLQQPQQNLKRKQGSSSSTIVKNIFSQSNNNNNSSSISPHFSQQKVLKSSHDSSLDMENINNNINNNNNNNNFQQSKSLDALSSIALNEASSFQSNINNINNNH